jgi:hypothetical protein
LNHISKKRQKDKFEKTSWFKEIKSITNNFNTKWHDKYTIACTISKFWKQIQALKSEIICDIVPEQEIAFNATIPIEYIKGEDNSGIKKREILN